jgi:thiamine-phosphate pyrophosphorylase
MGSNNRKPASPDERPAPRLYLVTPPVMDAQAVAAKISAVIEAADVAAVLLRLADGDERTQTNRIKSLAPAIQKSGAAMIVEGHAELAARGGADGAHLAGTEALAEALPVLKPSRIAGAGGLHTRHDAMIAAESGADYVMFGEPDEKGHRPSPEAVLDRIEWWAEVFEIPCVAYAERIAEIVPLCAAGADFIAIGEAAFADPQALAAAMNEAAARALAKSPA